MADHIFGPWKELGNPCTGPDADKTFHAQSTHMLQVNGQADRYIAMFDRWKQWDLADSRYVWLPMQFDQEGIPSIPWRDTWTLDGLDDKP
jgi:beta-galactosidase